MGWGPRKNRTLPVVAEHMRETFECERLNARLSRVACGTRSKYAGKLRAGPKGELVGELGKEYGRYSACRGCEIGFSHQRGEAPPAAPAVARPERVGPAVPVYVEPPSAFELNIAKSAEMLRERRAPAPPKRKRASGVSTTTWGERRHQYAKNCRTCGKPKPEGKGRRQCDSCNAVSLDRRRERWREKARAKAQRVREARHAAAERAA